MAKRLISKHLTGKPLYREEIRTSDKFLFKPKQEKIDYNQTLDKMNHWVELQKIRERQGEIREDNKSPIVKAINNYVGEALYRLLNGKPLTGKHVIPGIILASSLASLPLVTTAMELVGGAAGGETVNAGSKALTGKTFSLNLSEYTGLNLIASEFFNPGYLVAPYIPKLTKAGYLAYKLSNNNLTLINHPTSNKLIFYNPSENIDLKLSDKLWNRYKIFKSERPTKLNLEEKLGIPKMQRNQPIKSKILYLGEFSDDGNFIPVEEDIFGDLLGTGANKIVYRSAKNPNKVYKIDINRFYMPSRNPKELIGVVKHDSKHNKVPFYKKTRYVGYIKKYGDYYPVYEQDYSPTINPKDFNITDIITQFEKAGYRPNKGTQMALDKGELDDLTYYGLDLYNVKNPNISIRDLRPANMTHLNGKYYLIDFDF